MWILNLMCFFFLQVLKACHFPVTVTVVQFAVGTVLVTFMWALNLYKRPKITGAMVFCSLLIQLKSMKHAQTLRPIII